MVLEIGRMPGSVFPEKTGDFTHRHPAALAMFVEIASLARPMLVRRAHDIKMLGDREILVGRRAAGIQCIGRFKAWGKF